MVFTLCFVVPLAYQLAGLTLEFNSMNWWQDKNENFVTNASIFNAIVAWIYWFLIWIYILVFCLCLLVITILTINKISRRGVKATVKLIFFNLAKVLKIILDYILGIIMLRLFEYLEGQAAEN